MTFGPQTPVNLGHLHPSSLMLGSAVKPRAGAEGHSCLLHSLLQTVLPLQKHHIEKTSPRDPQEPTNPTQCGAPSRMKRERSQDCQ